jgi:hypothetical protein
MTINLAKNIGRGGNAARLSRRNKVTNVIVYFLLIGKIKGLRRPLRENNTKNIVTVYKENNKENPKKEPDINPIKRKELLDIEETTSK